MADTTEAGTTQNTGTETATTSLLTSEATPVEAGTPVPENQAQTEKDAAAPEDGKAKEEAEAPKSNAPEKYEFTAPEGVALNQEAVEAFEPVARELDLTQEQAQKLVNLYATQQQKQVEAWQGTIKGWTDATKADKEIGGAHLTESLNAGKAFLKSYGTPELAKLLDDYGIGNHPEVIRAFAKAGKAMAEDKFHSGGPANGATGNHFFPTTKRT